MTAFGRYLHEGLKLEKKLTPKSLYLGIDLKKSWERLLDE